METLSVILPQLSASDWAVSIDLRDVYLHIPIHRDSRRFLGFQFLGLSYQYVVLPFGLKDSPWVFTRVVATLVAHLRRLGLRMFYYLDDWLLVAESKELLESHLQTALRWTQDLGFLVNWEKSALVPQRLPSYLGAQLDFPNMLTRPLEHRVLSLQTVIRDLLNRRLATALLWQKFLGHLASFVDLVPHCRLLMRPLQLHLLRFFTPSVDPPDRLVPLSPEIRVLCRAWSSPARLLEGKPFAPPPHSLVLTTDASKEGWGAVLHPHQVSGVWSKLESLDHLNALEMRVVLLALQSLESLVLGHSVLIHSDNMTVVSNINHQGGTLFSSLCRLALVLWEWCLQRRVFPSGSSISTRRESRDVFLSWRIDALSFLWKDLRLYAFPPFFLLPRILNKIAQEEADLLLVASFWPQRPWFPCLLVSWWVFPRFLPFRIDLVVQPLFLFPHSNVESLHFSLWPLSGNKGRRQDFLVELRSSQQSPSESHLGELTFPDWVPSEHGVTGSLVIPFLLL